MSKNNSSILCNVLGNNGIDSYINDLGEHESIGKISVETKKGVKLELYLKDIWLQAIDYLWIGSEILVHYIKKDPENNQLTLDIDGYLVLEPGIMVSPSTIRNTEGCIRKHYVNRRSNSSSKNYPMVRGTLVNNAFDILVNEDRQDNNNILDRVLKNSLIDLISLNDDNLPEPEQIKAEISQHLRALSVWKTHKKFLEHDKKSTEPTVISRKYGMSGRLDLLVNPGKDAITYELKTSKAPESIPWSNDRAQVACYQLLLESAYECTNPDSYLIYSKGKGNDLLKQCSITKETRREVINTRNKIVSIDHALLNDNDDNPDFKKLIPATGIANCRNCYAREECFSICQKFNEKDCNGCNVNKICKNYEHNTVKEDIDYYNKYFKLIESERHNNRKSFSRIFDDMQPIINEGKAILDLNFLDIEERILKLNSDNVIESEIKPGDIVLLYGDKIVRGEVFKANIKHIDRNSVHLSLKKDVKKEYFQDQKWNIYIDTMETTFDTMNTALYSFMNSKNIKKRELLLGRKKPSFDEIKNIKLDESLNDSQQMAIKKALAAKDYFLIQGPPGTGKTHTLANLIIELIRDGKKVLLSAFTHRSIDNVLIKLIELGFTNFLRIGSHESVDRSIHPYLTQELFKNRDFDDLKIIQKELNNFPLLACSSITAMSSALVKRLKFDVAVIDEAGQLTEPGALSVVLQADKFILVGDHKQLPPVVQSEQAKGLGLSTSLFEKLINMNRENHDDVLVTLQEQYRMNENI
ncbi:MAG: AAA family ATPase, partial [Candidatus Sericytochromatia bacterium]|nr:AAA family ATPase [Candidatus Sericytochromatia bacterium]